MHDVMVVGGGAGVSNRTGEDEAVGKGDVVLGFILGRFVDEFVVVRSGATFQRWVLPLLLGKSIRIEDESGCHAKSFLRSLSSFLEREVF